MSKEKFFIRKQRKEEEYSHKLRRQKTKKLLLILLPVLLAIGASVFLLNNSTTQKPSQTGIPKIEINPKEIDAGNVSMAAGLVIKDFEIRNVGSGDLKINDIWTSCHCTTATLDVAGKKSPVFGMGHAGFWSQIIAPGETGQLEVIFNPAFHGPQGTGPAVREIYLSTNDSQNGKIAVILTANVAP